VALRNRAHLPIAVFLSVAVAVNVVRWALGTYIIWPANPLAGPLTGGARVAGHVEQALFIAWPAGIGALGLWIFLRRRPWPVAIVWMMAVLALVVSYPGFRGAAVQSAYLAAELAGLAVSLGALLTWAWRYRTPQLHHTATGLLIGIDLGSLVAAWRGSVFLGTWPLAQGMYAVLYATLMALHGGGLWISRSSSHSE
jgi:hypothetical protein